MRSQVLLYSLNQFKHNRKQKTLFSKTCTERRYLDKIINEYVNKLTNVLTCRNF